MTATSGERSVARRQVSVFVDGPVGEEIAGLRRRWDPVMAGRIDPHVTVVYDCDDAMVVRLSDVASSWAPFTLRVGSPRCWGEPAGGIYLPVFDGTDALGGLRERLGAVAPAGVTYRAHVTITHLRTTPIAMANAAWRALEHRAIGGEWIVRELNLVRFTDDGWRVESRAGLDRS